MAIGNKESTRYGKISVIIPVYNSQEYLADCINSILNQTYENIELLCVDDGSTDKSYIILKELAKTDKRIKIISQDNSGVSVARNTGIEQATGDWITFVDSDDTLNPDMYFNLIEKAIEYNADIVHCGYRKKYPDGSYKDIGGTKRLLVQGPDEACNCLFNGYFFTGGVWNKIYRKSIVNSIKFDSRFQINEDVLFNLMTFINCETIVFYDLPLYEYYDRVGSACNTTKRVKKAADCSGVARLMTEYCKNRECYYSALRHLYRCLINESRQLVLSNDLHEVKSLKIEIENIEKKLENVSLKYKFNNYFMFSFPRIYKLIYNIYDKYRVPNWEIREED